MSSGLDKLVSNLPKDDLIYTSKVFKGKRLNLMSQKGVYPYDFMDSFEKFNQTELPTKDQFYSILHNQHITDDEYDHAKKVWKTFKIKTMGEYHDLYLESDVLLLADVFESFRKTCLQYYNYRHQSFYQTYRPLCFWTRYRFSLLLQNIGFHTSGQDMTPSFTFILFKNIGLHTSGPDIPSFKMDNVINDPSRCASSSPH